MKQPVPIRPEIKKSPWLACLLFTMAVYCIRVIAEDSDFIVCANYSNRDERVACLERALEAAVADRQFRDEEMRTPPEDAVEPIDDVTKPIIDKKPPVAIREITSENKNSKDTLGTAERLDNFGREPARISPGEDGEDRLHDTITVLRKRRGLWIITLSSGQVWKQEVSRRFNLQQGDDVTIYRGGFGNGYRLTSDRLSGFIRVERIE